MKTASCWYHGQRQGLRGHLHLYKGGPFGYQSHLSFVSISGTLTQCLAIFSGLCAYAIVIFAGNQVRWYGLRVAQVVPSLFAGG